MATEANQTKGTHRMTPRLQRSQRLSYDDRLEPTLSHMRTTSGAMKSVEPTCMNDILNVQQIHNLDHIAFEFVGTMRTENGRVNGKSVHRNTRPYEPMDQNVSTSIYFPLPPTIHLPTNPALPSYTTYRRTQAWCGDKCRRSVLLTDNQIAGQVKVDKFQRNETFV